MERGARSGGGVRSVRLGHAPNCSSLGNVLNVLVWTQAAAALVWVAAEAWPARRRRPEPDGGETRLVEDPPATVRTGGSGRSSELGAPLEAHVQVTRACGLPCVSCHVEPEADGAHVPIATLDARFRALAERGVMRVAVGGGEALRHPDLPDVAAAAARHGLVPAVTTSGVGLARDPSALDGFAQVNVSLDALGDGFVASRGYDGAEGALAAIRALAARGRRVGVNIVLDRRTFPELGRTVRAAADAGARDVQLLRLKPVGRATRDYASRRLTPEQALAVWPTVRALLGEHPELTFRADCSLVPFLAAHGLDAERMRAFGFLGCHGGEALVSVDTAGRASPCSFFPADPEESDGLGGEAGSRWRSGVTTGPCATCAYRDLCRGGCHAVARHVTGDAFAPDPECPLVTGS